jgi:uncharacterized membrane protein
VTKHKEEKEMWFINFMASPLGRLARIAAGVALIAAGLVMQSVAGYVVAAIGVVPLAAGLFDVCILAPVFSCPLRGRDIRRRA